jgi:hypothetical protein
MGKVNWFGVVGGVLTLVLVGVSLFVPWWRLTAGENLLVVDVSPVATGFSLFGKALTVPLIGALNLSGLLTFLACGIAMLVYSVLPLKFYSKHLLNFAYLTPLLGVVFLVVGLFLMVSLVRGYIGLSVPVVGSVVSTLPSSLTKDVTVKAAVSGGFVWPFWVAVVCAGFCVVAKVYHRKIVEALAL